MTISGIVDEDGKLREPKIKMSSRAASIDAAALADVPSLLFSPARDADGKAISVPITWPAGKKDRIYGTLKGMVVMRALHTGNRPGDFDGEWNAAIEACRTQPAKHMLDMLKPDGELIRSMTKR